MELEEAIRSRRSIRRYEEREVPTDLILKAIGLACWAPSSANSQPWKFYVVRSRGVIEAMADAVQEKVDLLASWPEAESFGDAVKAYQRTATCFRSASVIVAIAVGEYQSLADRIVRARGDGDPVAVEVMENRAAIDNRAQIAASVTAHLLLALHGLGLGGCWMAGAMVARRDIERLLGVPDDMRLYTLVPVGYPAEAPAPGPRKRLEEVVVII